MRIGIQRLEERILLDASLGLLLLGFNMGSFFNDIFGMDFFSGDIDTLVDPQEDGSFEDNGAGKRDAKDYFGKKTDPFEPDTNETSMAYKVDKSMETMELEEFFINKMTAETAQANEGSDQGDSQVQESGMEGASKALFEKQDIFLQKRSEGFSDTATEVSNMAINGIGDSLDFVCSKFSAFISR